MRTQSSTFFWSLTRPPNNFNRKLQADKFVHPHHRDKINTSEEGWFHKGSDTYAPREKKNHSTAYYETQTTQKRTSTKEFRVAVLAIRKKILSIYNRNSKNHYQGPIKENCIENRQEFLELCNHPEVNCEKRLGILRHILKGNYRSMYRNLTDEGKKLA